MSTLHRVKTSIYNTERRSYDCTIFFSRIVNTWALGRSPSCSWLVGCCREGREERSRGKYVVNHLVQELRPSGFRHPSRDGNISGGSEVEALTHFGGAALLRQNQASLSACLRSTDSRLASGKWTKVAFTFVVGRMLPRGVSLLV
ncbi:hypothetical protein M407DRAFT_159370 [Tulasnella calospora MUT 4182]|uniref:Uncharacterized protein n=1 Tax=Tulasnella calospora MUT 4182 TaxID=1051891 RepID=A0A0C3Q4W5_9AGAM|nr:hypothetical protein M407DRAFT_159370 [Tulasnella calospora MUT 4182]